MITKELFYVTGNTEAFLPTIFCHGKATSITHSDSLTVALIIQYAMCMLRIIMPSETCMAVPYFSALSHEGCAFRKKKVIEHENLCFDFVCKFSELCLVLGRTERHIVINVHWS